LIAHLAKAFQKAGCFEEAIRYYKKSIRLDPGNSTYSRALARLYSSIGYDDPADHPTGNDRAAGVSGGKSQNPPRMRSK